MRDRSRNVSAAEVVAFVRREFDEGGEAADRIRGRRYGWEIDTQSREFINTQDSAWLLIGNGPVLIDRHTGDYWYTSSSPVDVFGDATGRLGWSQLTSRALFEHWRSVNGSPSGNIRDDDSRLPPEPSLPDSRA